GQGIIAVFEPPLFEPFLKDKKNRGAREIPDVAENIPGRLRVALARAQFRLDVAEQARSTGMQNPAPYRFALSPVTFEKSFDQAANFPADHFGDLFVQNNVESGIAEIKPHRKKRIRKGVRLRNQEFGPRRRLSANDYRGGAASIQHRRDHIALGNV